MDLLICAQICNFQFLNCSCTW